MTKERLRQYRHLKNEEKQLRLKLEEVETALYSPRGQRLDGMPRNPSGGGDALSATLLMRHEALQQAYTLKRAEVMHELLAIEQAIDSLPSIQRQLFRHRYIDGLKWEDVANAIGYELTHTHRLHSAGLARLREKK